MSKNKRKRTMFIIPISCLERTLREYAESPIKVYDGKIAVGLGDLVRVEGQFWFAKYERIHTPDCKGYYIVGVVAKAPRKDFDQTVITLYRLNENFVPDRAYFTLTNAGSYNPQL